MTVEIKGHNKLLNTSESLICDYKDVTIKETKKRCGNTIKEIRVQPEGVKRAKVFSQGFFSSITMIEATTGKTMLHWEI